MNFKILNFDIRYEDWIQSSTTVVSHFLGDLKKIVSVSVSMFLVQFGKEIVLDWFFVKVNVTNHANCIKR